MVRFSLLSFVVGFVACADPGPAPTVSSLTCDRAELVVGTSNSLLCTVGFEDLDGNVESVGVHFTDPASMQVSSEAPLVGASGVASGAGRITLILAPTAVGSATLDVHVVDANGNHSGKVSLSLACVAP